VSNINTNARAQDQAEIDRLEVELEGLRENAGAVA
jgi:hypothetical protein